MITFLQQNFATIIIAAVLAAVLAKIIVKAYRDRKNGKSGCGRGCSDCPSASVCHSEKK